MEGVLAGAFGAQEGGDAIEGGLALGAFVFSDQGVAEGFKVHGGMSFLEVRGEKHFQG